MTYTPAHTTVTLRRARGTKRGHRVPVCLTTGLARYRDRKQARDAITASTRRNPQQVISVYACPDCHGYHHETHTPAPRLTPTDWAPATAADTTRPRRYMLIDWENLTHGIRQSRTDLHALVRVLTKEAPGICDTDHVVIGASRYVIRSHRWLFDQIPHAHIVIGADTTDGADQALLSAINIHHVARNFDELVIGSGDHAFAPLAHKARQLGLAVQTVTTETPNGYPLLSRALASQATTRTRIRLLSRTLKNARAQRLRTIAAATLQAQPAAA